MQHGGLSSIHSTLFLCCFVFFKNMVVHSYNSSSKAVEIGESLEFCVCQTSQISKTQASERSFSKEDPAGK